MIIIISTEELRVESGFHHTFWFGNLNYRVNGSPEVCEKLLNDNLIEVLLANDQLNVEKNLDRTLIQFTEVLINFY